MVDSSSLAKSMIRWPDGSSIKQSFSLPLPIVRYIAANPSTSKVYNKLIQSCKYFFERNPILVVNYFTAKKICSNKDSWKKLLTGKECCVDYDINKLPIKIWLKYNLCICEWHIPINYLSLLRPKIYRSEIGKLSLFDQNICYDDFKFLVTSVTKLTLYDTQVFYNDETVAGLDDILEAVSHVKEVYYRFSNGASVNPLLVQNIAKLKNKHHIKDLKLVNAPESFKNVDLLSLKKVFKTTKLFLDFNWTISEEYKEQLDAVINTVIWNRVSNFVIFYEGHDAEKYDYMKFLSLSHF